MFASLGFLVVLSGTVVVACSSPEDDCANTKSCDSGSGPGSGGGGNGPADECAPGPGTTEIPENCKGFFLSASGSDAGEGTKDAPLQTFARALDLAVASTEVKRIYVCAGEFNEAVTVAAGIEIYGGLDCDDDWKYVGDTKKTIIAPPAGMVPLTLQSGEGKTVIADIEARAADAMAPGGSSIAAIIDGVTASLVRSVFQAGAGVDGDKGATPTESIGPDDPTHADIRGNNGMKACMNGTNDTPGAEAKMNMLCPTASGGAGGVGKVDSGGKGGDGLPVPDSNPEGYGLGGAGAMVGNCKVGEAGGFGTNGASGAGAQELGTLSSSGIAGASGVDGSPGTPGQGGGGGGGAKGKTTAPMCSGGSGGGGGAGGCGGAGGKGGQAGGSSIGIVSVNATLSFTDITLRTGVGGKGGEGGDGQDGGIGGIGGTGGLGAGAGSGTFPACNGGAGGVGGFGGKGGGGRGGHSIAIAYTGDTPPDATFETGTSGEGGSGADEAGNGQPGIKADKQQF
jgi:hypothetical protein